MITRNIQPDAFSSRDYMGSGTDGAAHTTDRDGNPNVLSLDEGEGKLKLNANNAKPLNRWNADNRFVFRVRKSFLFRA